MFYNWLNAEEFIIKSGNKEILIEDHLISIKKTAIDSAYTFLK